MNKTKSIKIGRMLQDVKRASVKDVDRHPTEKACQHCGCVKPIDDFHKHAQTVDRRQSWCKQCESERKKQRRREKNETSLQNLI